MISAGGISENFRSISSSLPKRGQFYFGRIKLVYKNLPKNYIRCFKKSTNFFL